MKKLLRVIVHYSFRIFLSWLLSIVFFLPAFLFISPVDPSVMAMSEIRARGVTNQIIFVISYGIGTVAVSTLFFNKRLYRFTSLLLLINWIIGVILVISLSNTDSPVINEQFTNENKPYSARINKPADTKLSPEILLALVNEERVKSRISQLEVNDKLNEAAFKKAEHMCTNQYWSHTAPDGTTPWSFIQNENFDYASAGENLARDFEKEEEIVSSWMKSTSHKENIINPKYIQTGIGIKECDFMGYTSQVVVELFARPANVSFSTSQTADTFATSRNLDPNEPIHCPKSPECGGGTIPLKRWECEQSSCCQKRDLSWVFYKDKNKCIEDQKKGL